MFAEKCLISVLQLEEKIFQLEGVVIRIRASSDTQVFDYGYTRKAPETQTVSVWLQTRVVPCLRGFEFCIIGGNFSSVMGQTSLKALRESYVSKSTKK